MQLRALKLMSNGMLLEAIIFNHNVVFSKGIQCHLISLCCVWRESHTLFWRKLMIKGGDPCGWGKNGPCISHLMFAYALLLTGEARESQIRCVMDIIFQSSDIPGQEVSEEKTCFMFSKNVSSNLQGKLLQMSKFRETNYMGKYLGVTLSGNTLRRKQNKYLMEKLS